MKKILPALMILLFAFACERQELMDSTPRDQQPEPDHVYIFGRKGTGTGAPYTLYCWKDFVQVPVEQAPAGKVAYPNKALSDGGNVYLIGFTAPDPGYSSRIACYWKNGTRKDLTAAPDSYVHGGCVSNGVLYIYGREASVDCLWVNDTKYTLSFTPGYYQSIDVAVTSNSIYLVGTKSYPNQMLGYWKISLPLGDSATPLNGTYTDLNGTDTGSGAYNAYVINDEVVIAGYRNYGGYYYPTIWRNGTPTAAGNSSSSIVTAMYVFGDAETPSCLLTQGVTAGASVSETVLARGGTVLAVPFPSGYVINPSWTGAAETPDGFVITGHSQQTYGTPFTARYWDNDTASSTVLSDAGDTVNAYYAEAVTVGKGW